jgi:hypothetical protein
MQRVLKEDGVVLLNLLVTEHETSRVGIKGQYNLGFFYSSASVRKYRALFKENNFDVKVYDSPPSHLVVKGCVIGPIAQMVLTKKKEGEPPKNIF